jgi:hypothetical protein
MPPTGADWYQQSLTPPDVLEVRIRLGVIPATDHVQVQVDLYDPMTSILVGQWSKPHGALATWPAMLDEAAAKAHQMLGDAVEPF